MDIPANINIFKIIKPYIFPLADFKTFGNNSLLKIV